MKHLLKLLDWTSEDINEVLNLADQLKYEQKHHIAKKYLEGKTLGLIVEKASTRLFSSPATTHRLAEASLFRIRLEYFHATLTEL